MDALLRATISRLRIITETIHQFHLSLVRLINKVPLGFLPKLYNKDPVVFIVGTAFVLFLLWACSCLILGLPPFGPDLRRLEQRKIRLGPWVDYRRWLENQKAGGKLVFEKSQIPASPGPAITYHLDSGFCGANEIEMSRFPQEPVGTLTWTKFMAIAKPADEKGSTPYKRWRHKPFAPLMREGKIAQCIKINRATLMAMMALTNARCIYTLATASGYRAGFECYGGVWTIQAPVGRRAIVRFNSSSEDCVKPADVYPRTFMRRMDKCIEMLAGIISFPDSSPDSSPPPTKCAFQNRNRTKAGASYILVLQRKAYSSFDGSSYFYGMMGGKIHGVDLLSKKLIAPNALPPPQNLGIESYLIRSFDPPGADAVLLVPSLERSIVHLTLDSLPWTTVSWSIHPGMKDLLLAIGKAKMESYRTGLAFLLRRAVTENQEVLKERGWDADFARDSMPDMVENAVSSGGVGVVGGTTADVVRVITEATMLCCTDWKKYYDVTTFWRKGMPPPPGIHGPPAVLADDTIIALTKYVVLEWSNELDYQHYREMPMELLFV